MFGQPVSLLLTLPVASSYPASLVICTHCSALSAVDLAEIESASFLLLHDHSTNIDGKSSPNCYG